MKKVKKGELVVSARKAGRGNEFWDLSVRHFVFMEHLVQFWEYQGALHNHTKPDDTSYVSNPWSQGVILFLTLNSISDIFSSSLCMSILLITLYLK